MITLKRKECDLEEPSVSEPGVFVSKSAVYLFGDKKEVNKSIKYGSNSSFPGHQCLVEH